MPEAVAQMRREASTFARELEDLNRQALEVRRNIEEQSPILGAAARQLETYREQMSTGARLTAEQSKNATHISEVLSSQGGDLGQRYLQIVRRMDDLQNPQQFISRPLLEDEREAARQRGTSDEEMERTRVVGGTRIVYPPGRRPQGAAPAPTLPPDEESTRPLPPEGRPGPQPEADDAGPLPSPADDIRPVPRPGPAPPREPRPDDRGRALEEESSRVVDAMAPEVEAHRRRAAIVRASAMNERELHREWRETQKLLTEQHRDLRQAEERFSTLDEYRKSGTINLSDREEFALDRLPGRIRDLREGMAQLRLEQEAMAEVGRSRGMVINDADQLVTPQQGGGGGGGMFGRVAGALGGAGGGGMGIGLGLRMFGTAATGGLLAAGILAGVEAFRFLNRSAETYEDTQRRIFDTGMRLGGGFDTLREQSQTALRGPLRITFEEQMQSRLALAMQMGQADAGGVQALARAYGLDVGATAGLIGRMGTLGAMPMSSPVGRAPGRPAPVPMLSTAPMADDGTRISVDSRGASGSWGPPVEPDTRSRTDRRFDVTNGDAAAMADRATDDAKAMASKALDWLGALGGGQFYADSPQPLASPRPQPGPQPGRPTPATSATPAGRTGGGIEDILARSYSASGLDQGPGGSNALMSSYMEHIGRLLEQQTAAGGAPLGNYEFGPAMMARAVDAFGDTGITPGAQLRFGAQMVGGMVQGLQAPQDTTQRGIQLRAIMQMGRGMTPEQLAEFRRSTEAQAPGGGLDPTTYTGAIATMQNMTSLDEPQRSQVMEAVLSGLTRVTGTGDMRAMTFSNMFYGGQAAPGIALNRVIEDLTRSDLSGEQRVDLNQQFRKLMEQAGSEGVPWAQDREMAGVETSVGRIARIGQSIKQGLLDFATYIEDSQAMWDERINPVVSREP